MIGGAPVTRYDDVAQPSSCATCVAPASGFRPHATTLRIHALIERDSDAAVEDAQPAAVPGEHVVVDGGE